MSELMEKYLQTAADAMPEAASFHETARLARVLQDALEARDKAIAELVAAFAQLIELAPETLACGYRCSLEIEHMEEEAYSAALGNAKFALSQAQSKDKAE